MDLSIVPVVPPPLGLVPNFNNPPSRGYEVIITVAICLSAMVPIVSMRIYTRVVISRSLGWDDYACIVGAIGTIVFAAFMILFLKFGFGRHNWDVSMAMFGSGGPKYTLLANMVAGLTFFFIRLSILLLYLRIFSLNQKTRGFLYFGVSTIFTFTVVSTTLYGTFCVPRKYQSWKEAAASPRCSSSQEGLEIANGAFNAISDIYILLLPLPSIWGLQLPMRKRIALMATFLTGLFACTCSLASLGIRIKFLRDGDFTWNATPILYSAVIEQNVGIICSCLPTCRLFYRHYFPGPMHTPSAESSRYGILSKTKYSIDKLLLASSADSQNTHCAPDRISLELGEGPKDQIQSNKGEEPSFDPP